MLEQIHIQPPTRQSESQGSLLVFLAHDYQFLFKLYPMTVGLSDKVISNLYKKLIDELRRIHAESPLEPAWELNHSTHTVLTTLLGNCSFGTSALEEPRVHQMTPEGTGSLHQPVQRAPRERTNTKGSPRKRGSNAHGATRKIPKKDTYNTSARTVNGVKQKITYMLDPLSVHIPLTLTTDTRPTLPRVPLLRRLPDHPG